METSLSLGGTFLAPMEVPSLQRRQEWTTAKPNLKVGDVVLMRDSQSPRNSWPLGIVVRTFPGSDGLARKVELRSKSSLLTRPVNKLILLVLKCRLAWTNGVYITCISYLN